MPAPPTAVSRRDRLRAQTLAEIKEHALAQVADGGPDALSLSAIARSMGMSGPALYRYYGSRDDLLVALVTDSYEDLADTLEAAAAAARRRAPAARLRALAAAYRDWALAHPHRYRLVFSSTHGSGRLAPDRTIPAAHRSMAAFLDAIAALSPASEAAAMAGPRTALDRQLELWAADRAQNGGIEGRLPAAVLQLGIVAWTRLHGVVSLEIEGTFASMDVDPALLYGSEVDELVARARAAAATAPVGGLSPARRRARRAPAA